MKKTILFGLPALIALAGFAAAKPAAATPFHPVVLRNMAPGLVGPTNYRHHHHHHHHHYGHGGGIVVHL